MAWIAAIAGLAGAALSSDAAGDAADASGAGSAAAVGEQRRQYNTTRDDFAPYRGVGYGALAQLAQAYGIPGFQVKTQDTFDPRGYLKANPDVAADPFFAGNPWEHYQRHGRGEGRKFTALPGSTYKGGSGGLTHDVSAADVMSDPGYAFGLSQGQQAIDRKIAAGGGRVSGQAIKAAARFGTDYGTTKYGEAYQRRQDRLNRLQALAGIGQTSTNSSAIAGANSTNAISGLMQGQGEMNAGARMAQGSIWGDAFNQIGALYGRQRQPSGAISRSPYVASSPYDVIPSGYEL